MNVLIIKKSIVLGLLVLGSQEYIFSMKSREPNKEIGSKRRFSSPGKLLYKIIKISKKNDDSCDLSNIETIVSESFVSSENSQNSNTSKKSNNSSKNESRKNLREKKANKEGMNEEQFNRMNSIKLCLSQEDIFDGDKNKQNQKNENKNEKEIEIETEKPFNLDDLKEYSSQFFNVDLNQKKNEKEIEVENVKQEEKDKIEIEKEKPFNLDDLKECLSCSVFIDIDQNKNKNGKEIKKEKENKFKKEKEENPLLSSHFFDNQQKNTENILKNENEFDNSQQTLKRFELLDIKDENLPNEKTEKKRNFFNFSLLKNIFKKKNK